MNPVAAFEGEAVTLGKAGSACASPRTSVRANDPTAGDRFGSPASPDLSFRSNWRAQLDSLIYGADAAGADGESADAANAVREGTAAKTPEKPGQSSKPSSGSIVRHKRSPHENLHSSSLTSAGVDSLSRTAPGSGMQEQVLRSTASHSPRMLASPEGMQNSNAVRETLESSAPGHVAGDSISATSGRARGESTHVEPVQTPMLPEPMFPELTGADFGRNAALDATQSAPGTMSQAIGSESLVAIAGNDSKAGPTQAQINGLGRDETMGLDLHGSADLGGLPDVSGTYPSRVSSMPEPLKSVSALNKNASGETETQGARSPVTAAQPVSSKTGIAASYGGSREESLRGRMLPNSPESSHDSPAENQPVQPSKSSRQLTAPTEITGQVARDRKDQGAPAVDVNQMERHAASSLNLTPSAVTEPVRDAAGVHTLAGVPGAESAASNRQSAGSAVSETFAVLDSGASQEPSAWRHFGAREAEAGYQDPTLGWVGVRAELSASGIHATVSAASSEAAQVLGGHMSGLNLYLAENRTPVESLTLSADSGLATGHGGSGGTADGGTQSQHGRAQAESLTPVAMVDKSASREAAEATAIHDGAVTMFVPGGRYISLMA